MPLQKLLNNFSNISSNFGAEGGVTEDLFLLDVSIRRQEILALLPLFDPAELQPYKYSCDITGSKKKQVQEKRILFH